MRGEGVKENPRRVGALLGQMMVMAMEMTTSTPSIIVEVIVGGVVLAHLLRRPSSPQRRRRRRFRPRRRRTAVVVDVDVDVGVRPSGGRIGIECGRGSRREASSMMRLLLLPRRGQSYEERSAVVDEQRRTMTTAIPRRRSSRRRDRAARSIPSRRFLRPHRRRAGDRSLSPRGGAMMPNDPPGARCRDEAKVVVRRRRRRLPGRIHHHHHRRHGKGYIVSSSL